MSYVPIRSKEANESVSSKLSRGSKMSGDSVGLAAGLMRLHSPVQLIDQFARPAPPLWLPQHNIAPQLQPVPLIV